MSTAVRTYSRGRKLVAMRDAQAGTNRYYHYDHQGTTQCLTDGAGAVTDRSASDAWGVQVKRTGSTINRQWYIGRSGYYEDASFIRLYVRNRHLHTSAGRWRSGDPLGSRLGPLYPYVQNRPISDADASGLISCAEIKGQVKKIQDFASMGYDERNRAIRKLYQDIATYLAEQGYPLSSGNMSHWLNGGKPDPKVFPASTFRNDKRTREREAQIHSCLINAIDIPKCCPFPRIIGPKCPGTSVWPSTTDLAGAFGFYLLKARMSCGGPVVSVPGFIQCSIEYWVEDRYDWNKGQRVPCLPNCKVEILDEWGDRITKDLRLPTYYNIKSESWYTFFQLKCPRRATRRECCPADPDKARKPDDWPGPGGCFGWFS